MTSHPYSTLIRCKAWADAGLYEAVARDIDRLDPGDKAIMPLILDHIHAVDRIFQAHLMGRPHGYRAPRSDAPPVFEALAKSTAEVDDWYVGYVESHSGRDFDEPLDFTFTSGKSARMSRGEILLHVCQHGAYHRGNAGVLLQKAGSALYRDGVTDFLETRTAA